MGEMNEIFGLDDMELMLLDNALERMRERLPTYLVVKLILERYKGKEKDYMLFSHGATYGAYAQRRLDGEKYE